MRPIHACCAILTLCGTNFAIAEEAPSRPNFVIVLADDLGYGDLGCYGAKETRTPHLDAFAAEGLRLTSCYAGAPVCSPSRASLMTGRFSQRVGIHDWIPYDCPMHLRKSEITIATLLRQAGYDTCQSGKWHLNGLFNKPGQPQPADHGFSHWFATQNNALPNHRDPTNFARNGQQVGPLSGYAGPLVASEAIRWLREGRNAEQPFFLYVAFHEPHEPIATDPEFARLYPSDDPSFSAHQGNITQMDHAFGQLLTALDELQLRDDTFVMFTSDNGPAITAMHPHGSAGPLRDKKGSVYEGGIRVPGIIRWPGHTTPGSESDEPVCGVDLLPTLCAITGIEVPSDRKIDGVNILPILENKPITRPTPLFWQRIRATGGPYQVAMRDGDWKILATIRDVPTKGPVDIRPGDMQALKTAPLDQFVLYNLKEDIAEQNDRAKSDPEVFAAMREKVIKLYREIQEETPTWPEWTWSRYEGERIEWPEYTKRGQEQRQRQARQGGEKDPSREPAGER